MGGKTSKCFISYSHKDKKLCDKFITHFKNLSRFVDTEQWYDGKIPVGGNIDDAIKKELEIADIVFLLLSPDYIASFYCYEKELETAIRRSAEGKCIVVPVILKNFVPGDYLFSKLRYVPTDGKPITKFRPQDDGFVDAFKGIKNLLQDFADQKSTPNVPPQNSKVKLNTSKRGAANKAGSTKKNKASRGSGENTYKLVKNGKVSTVVLTQQMLSNFLDYSQTTTRFVADMNMLIIESIEQMKSLSNKSRFKNELHRQKLEGFLLQTSGYIQQHYLDYDSTCVHFRVMDGDVYKPYYDVGYQKNGLPIDSIPVQNSMIEYAIKCQRPVIKEFNTSLHKASHPEEKIKRNYVTFVFEKLAEKYNINMSMCISAIGDSAITNGLFTAMSVMRFDYLLEEYLLQYIYYSKKFDSKLDIAAIFTSKV